MTYQIKTYGKYDFAMTLGDGRREFGGGKRAPSVRELRAGAARMAA